MENLQPPSCPSQLVVAVFAEWRRQGVKFVILRNYAKVTQQVDGDIDLVVSPQDLPRAERIMVDSAHAMGWHLHNRAEFMPVSLFFYHRETQRQIQFDLFTDLRWRGFCYFSARKILASAVDQGSFWVPHPALEAVNSLMTRQIYHGYIKADYKPTIAAGFRNHPAEVQAALTGMFGTQIARELLTAVAAEDWSKAEAQTWAMRRQLVWRAITRRPIGTLRTLCADLRRFAGRLRLPLGVTVVLLGPDGSGKSTIAKALQAALDASFKTDKSRLIHWKPIVFFRSKRRDGPPTTDPHRRSPRGQIGSLAALGFHWLEYFLGGFFVVLPVRFRNGLVLFDRYYYDFEVDPRRFRLHLPWHWPLRMFRLLPRPDLVFLLDVSPETMLARKQEVPMAELQRQRDAFRSLVAKLPNGRIIPAELPLQAVVGEITLRILEHLKNRQARRTNSSSVLAP